MFSNKIKLRHLIVFAFLTPIAFNFFNTPKNNLDCNLEINSQKTECVQKNSTAVAANDSNLANQNKIGQVFSQIEKLSQQIQAPSNLQEINEIDTNKQKYNEQVLELLNVVPEEDQKKICQRNWDFIANDKVEAQIQDICIRVKPKTTGKIQGINNTQHLYLFEVRKEDLNSLK